MSMTVHNIMAFNHHFFRPQPVVSPKVVSSDKETKNFQDVLNEKLRGSKGYNK